MNASEKTARFVSYLFHPLLMPSYALLLMINLKTNISYIHTREAYAVFFITFICTFILPLLSAVLLLTNGYISSLHMESPAERKLPYISGAVFYGIGFYLIDSLLYLPRPISLSLLGAGISIVAALVINNYLKISMHAIGTGGCIGMLIGLSIRLQSDLRLIIAAAVMLAGVVLWARLKLNAHTPKEVYLGFLLGFLTEYSLLIYF